MLEEMEKLDGASMRVRDRIAAAVRFRIEVNLKHREAVRRGLSFLALPQNAELAARCAFDTVNAMWYAAGDPSADYNYYTKRALLAAVQGAAILYWLNDESENFGDTWSFLDRRIDDVMKIPKLQSRVTAAIERLAAPLSPFGRRGGRGFRARGSL
jgi:ubiquinone biosynthesis protein COQ9